VGTGLSGLTCVLCNAEAMKPGVKPRVPRPPEKVDRRESLTPHGNMEGHCLYDLEEPFSITLVSVSNVNVVDFSLVITTLLLSVDQFIQFIGLVFPSYSRLGLLSHELTFGIYHCRADCLQAAALRLIEPTVSKHFM